MKADEEQVKEVVKIISEMINPFENDPENHDLVSLSNGIMAPDDVAADLAHAYDRGNEAFKQFVSNKLLVKEPDIFSTIPKMKLKTFGTLNKPASRTTSKSQVVSLKTDRNTFARLFVIGQKRSIDVRKILSFCLGPYPLSLATATGNICKTTKATLLKSFQSEFPDSVIDDVPAATCVVIDAMAVLQSTVHVPETYGELAEDILARILAVARKFNASRVDFVSDRYPEQSIKNAERQKRASQGECSVRIYAKDQKVFKPWKKFLSNGKKKENLIGFLVDTWSNMEHGCLDELELYVTSGSNCKRMSNRGEILQHDIVME